MAKASDKIIRSRVDIKVNFVAARKAMEAGLVPPVHAALEDVRAATERDVQTRLGQEPGPTVHPIQWTSEKQRRYFWAVIAPRYMVDGVYLGYPRSGTLIRGWRVRVEPKPDGGLLSIYNRVPYGRYVYGNLVNGMHQQRFHRNTGWVTAHPIVREIKATAVQRAMLGIRGRLPTRVAEILAKSK